MGTVRGVRVELGAPPLPVSARPSAAVPASAVKVRLLSSKGAPPVAACREGCWWVIVYGEPRNGHMRISARADHAVRRAGLHPGMERWFVPAADARPVPR
ncbi:hypothetical protein GCM10027074_06040 [Streptomyces deserti]